MAVNTAEKRFSMISMGQPGCRKILFVVTGAVISQDRYHLEGLYSGISPANPTAAGQQQQVVYRRGQSGKPQRGYGP